MLRNIGLKVALAVGLTAAPFLAFSANIPLIPSTPTFSEASQIVGTLNFLINSLNSTITTQSLAPVTNYRNILDNGAMLVQQRGTGAATCGTTSGVPQTAYAADRWGCDVNVASGAGALTPITATPSPPAGFSQSLKLVRTGGILTQPQCAWQEVPTADVTAIAGQNVMLSAYVQALAGLAADQGSTTQTANLVIITGTGSDQGLGSLRGAAGMTASPALTPAWTGIATLQNTTLSLPVTPAWARYNGATVQIGSTVTELAVGICWTPTAAGQSATDGIAFTGVQLEVMGAGATAPSAFELRPKGVEVAKVTRYFIALNQPAAGVAVPVVGTAISSTVSTSSYAFPTPMDIAPIFAAYGTALSTSTWTLSNAAVNNALATTFIVTKTANTPNGASMTITSSGMTAGSATVLLGNNAGSVLGWSADF